MTPTPSPEGESEFRKSWAGFGPSFALSFAHSCHGNLYTLLTQILRHAHNHLTSSWHILDPSRGPNSLRLLVGSKMGLRTDLIGCQAAGNRRRNANN